MQREVNNRDESNIIEKIKYLQKKEVLTNYEMSVIIGIAEKSYEDWRSGRRKPPRRTLPWLKFIAEAFEKGQVVLTMADLLKKTGRKSS